MTSINHGKLVANRVSIDERRIHAVELTWQAGRIARITDLGEPDEAHGYLIPGFIDAHIHIESSMLPPSEFGRQALRHGTIAVVNDPHEIANVLGLPGVEFMLEDARRTPLKAFFGAPSCVPATPFETAYGELGCSEIEALLQHPEVCCLSEMMNFPGVLERDPAVLAKLELAQRLGYPVDGHAPGLSGAQAAAYAAAGISTDHECFGLDEARDKIAAGMSVLIREGSAARNFAALHPLMAESPDRVMLCSDDLHPDDLLKGHINRLVARAVELGHDLFDVLRIACLNPIDHYRLPLGRLREGDPMDALLVADLHSFEPERVWVDGQIVAERGESRLSWQSTLPVNRFHARRITVDEISLPAAGQIRVIEAHDGSLITGERLCQPRITGGRIVPDTGNDILPICVLNRYQAVTPAVGFIHGFGLKTGAIASSVAHDSHNLIAVGASLEALCRAVNALIDSGGGVAVEDSDSVEILPLPIAGLMSDRPGDQVGEEYARLDRLAKQLGSPLQAPFMTLSFMALLVIPELKLSDRGLFDGRTFSFTELVA